VNIIDIKRVAYNNVTPILQRCQKGQKRVVLLFSSSSSSSSHFLFPRNFPGTVADIINHTPLEPLRPADVPFGGYKTETKDLKGIFCRKIDFWL